MAEKITLTFTKGEYRRLLDMVYLGNVMLSAMENYNEEASNGVESKVFSKVAQIGRPQYAEFIDEYGGWLPTKAYEAKGIENVINEYNDTVFWDELIHRLALKDVAKFADIKNPDIIYQAIWDRSDQYEEFFQEHDFTKVYADGMPEMTIPETFRSMDVGEIDRDMLGAEDIDLEEIMLPEDEE